MHAPDLVVAGQVVLRASATSIHTAGAVAVREGRVVATGEREELLALAGRHTRLIDEPELAVVPGMHDFHLHLVGMARLRRELRLDGLRGPELPAAVRRAADRLPAQAWLRGRGWIEEALQADIPAMLADAAAAHPTLLYSHDAHSAWASPGALAAAGIGAATADPPGGRIERDAGGLPSGILRERATDLVERVAGRLRGPELERALDETVGELLALGVTNVVDAGDTTPENGTGSYAALGDRASLLMAAAPRLDGRLRVAIGLPAGAIAAAAELGLATGRPIAGHGTIDTGWAKAYADGALGSRTAALFAPYTCGPGDAGILRLEAAELDALLLAARQHGIGLAVHAIGDRAAATVLDALQRAPVREESVPPDRIEHLQLLRVEDLARLAALDVTASIQPVHAASDRDMVEACWADRLDLAYPWRSLARAGTRLAFGSDAPIETPNPWVGVFAAVHRRFPADQRGDWQPAQALDVPAALAAYTVAAARSAGRHDLGHLEVGAVADLAVLNVDRAALLAGDERLAGMRSRLTIVAGREVHRA